jgi:hypothetical protein
MSRTVVALVAACFVSCAYAQDMPVPKMFRGLQGQKGQYQVELLEGGPAGKGKPPVMTVCTDNLMKNAPAAEKAQAKSDCKQRLLKDTADEAVIENVCKDRTSTVTIKREGKSMLMDVQSTGPRGPDHMKIRYTHLGACREGQGALGMDPNSEQCKKMREQAAQMDPAKQCARQQQNREACEKMVRDAAAQVSSMCN